MADNNTNTVINTDTARMTEKQKVKEIMDRQEEGLKALVFCCFFHVPPKVKDLLRISML